VYEVEEEVFRPGVLYALGRISETAPEHIQPYQGVILQGLSDPNPLAKAYALIVVKHLDLGTGEEAAELRSRVQALSHDTGETWIYQGNNFKNIQINELAKETLQSIKIT
jgi:hypothetical protein